MRRSSPRFCKICFVPRPPARPPPPRAVVRERRRPARPGQATAEARQLQEQVRRLRVQDDKGNVILLDLSKPIRVMADPLQGGQGGGNRLILSSTPDNLKALSTVVAMMDAVPLGDTEVKIFRMKHASATRIAPLLQSVFAEGPPVPGTEGLSTQITRLRAVVEPGKPPLTALPQSRRALSA